MGSWQAHYTCHNAPMLAPHALIFDMDGLMIDSEPLWWDVERALAAEHGLSWSDELAHQCMGTGLPNAIATMRAELGLQIEINAGVRWLVDTFIARLGGLQLKPGLSELVTAGEAAGLPMAVASSSSLRLIHAVLERFELSPRFAVVISGESVPKPKPAPDIFLATAEQLSVAPSACVVLEDSVPGVKSACAANIPVIAIPELNHDAFGALTPHVLEDLHEARELLGL
jgi:beta-phosphoglucomutase-like phosphatase (HAD superfamily)